MPVAGSYADVVVVEFFVTMRFVDRELRHAVSNMPRNTGH